MDKHGLLARLPYQRQDTTIRCLSREDIDLRAGWPPYPEDYAAFNCNWGTLTEDERDALFVSRSSREDSIVLTADTAQKRCIAYLALNDIDWITGQAGNLGLRLHPDWCDSGTGTAIMRMLVGWCSEVGFARLRHDVCALNMRAVRCYEKAGYRITGDFQHDGTTFYWMEIGSAVTSI